MACEFAWIFVGCVVPCRLLCPVVDVIGTFIIVDIQNLLKRVGTMPAAK